nr:hypothetical protein [Pandoravirus massiliensis]
MQSTIHNDISDLPTLLMAPPRTDADILSTYDTTGPCQCLCCRAARVPAPSYIDWSRLRNTINCVSTAAVDGVVRCVRAITATAPCAFAFYGATIAIKAGVAALATRGSWLRCAVELRPLCYGHVSALAVACAATYAVDSVARDRKRRGLSTGLAGVASRVMHMAAALGATSCWLGSLAHRLAYTEALRERWWHYGIDHRYERGMADGIILCSVAAIAVASAVIVFQSPHKAVTDTRRALARIIDVDPTPAVNNESAPCNQRRADLDDLLLPLRDVDQAQPDPEVELSQQ